MADEFGIESLCKHHGLQTFTTLEAVKKDLTEFSDVVASEASALATTTVESVKHQAQNLQQIIEDEGTPLSAQTPTEVSIFFKKRQPLGSIVLSVIGVYSSYYITVHLITGSSIANS